MPFSRRQLFKLRPRDLTKEVVTEDVAAEEPSDPAPAFPRPPGALADPDAFLETCERCGSCASACPHEAIFKHGPATGRYENTPFLDPAQTACRWCEDFPCIEACPSGALARDPEVPVAAVAKVELVADRCINRQGILCDTCSYRCPREVRAIRMVSRMPVVDVDACTGCGMCVFFCEAEPSAFRFKPTSFTQTTTNQPTT